MRIIYKPGFTFGIVFNLLQDDMECVKACLIVAIEIVQDPKAEALFRAYLKEIEYLENNPLPN